MFRSGPVDVTLIDLRGKETVIKVWASSAKIALSVALTAAKLDCLLKPRTHIAGVRWRHPAGAEHLVEGMRRLTLRELRSVITYTGYAWATPTTPALGKTARGWAFDVAPW